MSFLDVITWPVLDFNFDRIKTIEIKSCRFETIRSGDANLPRL
jgi:hypothetical protein